MISERQLRTVYVAADFAATNIAWFLFNLSRFELLHEKISGSMLTYLTSRTVVAGQILFPLLMLALYWLSGYYNLVFRKSRAEELTSTFSTTLVGALVIFFLVLLNDMTDDLKLDYTLFGILFGILFLTVYFARWCVTSTVVNRLHSGRWGFPTLVIDCGQADRKPVIDTESARTMGFSIIGSINKDNLDRIGERVESDAVRCLIVSPDPAGPESAMAVINRLLPLECSIYIVPDQYQLLVSRTRTSNVTGDPLIDISRSEMPQSTINMKRVGDVIVSAAALLLLSPLLAAIAIAVRLDSDGPAFYFQRRIGYHKRPFDIVKFRTMRTDAEAGGPALSQGDDDPRITRLGRTLRKYRLDELPQFWNVLRGEMSLVGPRPEREFFIRSIMERAPYYALLHRVRPGITSWGMVRYGYASSIDQMIERMQFDLLYLENISFAVDFKIILHTIKTVLKGSGK